MVKLVDALDLTGVPKLSALVFVQIHIQDINNYAPVFSSTQSYTTSVSEQEETGMSQLHRQILNIKHVNLSVILFVSCLMGDM